MAEKKYFKVTLPIKPMHKKYLLSLYGDPLIYSSDHYFGMVLVACLEKKVRRDRDEQEIINRFDRLTDKLDIFCPSNWLYNYYHGIGLSREKVLFINKLVEERFEEELTMFCNHKVISGSTRRNAIELFCTLHGIVIEEDVLYDNLKKMDLRSREKMAKTVHKTPLDLSPELLNLKIQGTLF